MADYEFIDVATVEDTRPATQPRPRHTGRWAKPFCRIRQGESQAAQRRYKAMSAVGQCVVCGLLTDGMHSAPELPFYCDAHCIHCKGEK